MTRRGAKNRNVVGATGFYPRQQGDDYPTPAGSFEMMAAREMPGLTASAVWECAAGEGDLARRIHKVTGLKPISTTLEDRGWGRTGVDFLKTTRLLAPTIVTNPPFNTPHRSWSKFAQHAHGLGAHRVYLFGRLLNLESAHRQQMFKDTGLSRVWVHSERMDGRPEHVKKEGDAKGGFVAYAWFVWDIGSRPLNPGTFEGGFL